MPKTCLPSLAATALLAAVAARGLCQEPPTVEQLGALPFGEAVAKSLPAGTAHSWLLVLREDEFLEIDVEQPTGDLYAGVIEPSGSYRVFDDWPPEPERARWISGTQGLWLLQIGAYSPGDHRYTVTWRTRREPTAEDRLLVEADELRREADDHFIADRLEEAESAYKRLLRVERQRLGSDDPALAEVYSDLGKAVQGLGWYEDAQGHFERALEINRAALGDDHSAVAQSLNQIALALQYQGLHEQAIERLEQALGILGENPDHHNLVATCLINLAYSQDTLADYTGAERNLLRARGIAEALEEPVTLSSALNNLASLYSTLARFEEVETLQREVLRIREQLFGADSPPYAQALHNLGVFYSDSGRYQEAREPLERSLAIYETKLGDDHPELASFLDNMGTQARRLADYDAAERLYQRALDIRRDRLAADHPDVVGSMLSLAALASERGQPRKAEEIFRQAIDLERQAFGPEHPLVAFALNSLGITLQLQGRFADALEAHEEALEIQTAAFGPDHPRVAATLANLSSLAHERADFQRAVELLERVLSIYETTGGPDHPVLATPLDSLGSALVELERHEEAQRLFLRARSIREDRLGDTHPEVALSLDNLASLYATTGRYDESEALFLRALEIQRAVHGTENANYATALDKLGGLYDLLGRFEEAEDHYQRAMEIRRRVLGPSHPDVAVSHNQIGLFLLAKSQHDRAEARLRESLDLYSRVFGPDHPRVAVALVNLAGVDEARGDLAEAEPKYERAVEILERALGPEHSRVATALGNLGSLYHSQGRYQEADALLQRSLEIRLAVFGRDHFDTAVGYNNLATNAMARRDYDAAIELQGITLEILRQVLGPRHPSLAAAASNLGSALFASQRLAEARSVLEEALAVAEVHSAQRPLLATQALIELAALDHEAGQATTESVARIDRAIDLLESEVGEQRFLARAYGLRAEMRKAEGRDDDALDDLEEALEIVERLRVGIGGGEQLRARFLVPYVRYFDTMVDWRIEAGDLEEAYESSERARARVLLDQLAAARVDLAAEIPADRRAELEGRRDQAGLRLAEAQQRMTRLRAATDLPEDERLRRLEALEGTLRDADLAYQKARADLRNASPLWRDQMTDGGEPARLSRVQRELVPEEGLLLLYHLGSEHSHLFVVPPRGGELEVLPLTVGPEAATTLGLEPGALSGEALRGGLLEVEAAAADSERGEVITSSTGLLRRLTRSGDDARAGEAASGHALHALFDVLVPTELRPRLATATEVVIVPDGVLHLIPFEILMPEPPAADGRERFWIDVGPPLRYAPSATALYKVSQREAARILPDGSAAQVLSVSDPVFDPAQLAEVPGSSADSPAPAAAGRRRTYESRGGALSRLPGTALETQAILQAFEAHRPGSVLSLQRSAADEPRLRAALTGKRYLHFGTHGLVDQRRGALFASLALTPPAGEADGLENDGFLQLHEIYELELPEAELAVLSACESNIGAEVGGEGVFALSRGFLAAGARRVIASQWPVADDSSAALMSAFFAGVAATERAGEPVDFARILWEAKREVRAQDEWSHPLHWGPFVLIGKR